MKVRHSPTKIIGEATCRLYPTGPKLLATSATLLAPLQGCFFPLQAFIQYFAPSRIHHTSSPLPLHRTPSQWQRTWEAQRRMLTVRTCSPLPYCIVLTDSDVQSPRSRKCRLSPSPHRIEANVITGVHSRAAMKILSSSIALPAESASGCATHHGGES